MSLFDIELRAEDGGFSLDYRLSSDDRTVGVFGPSGAGKTTALEHVAGWRRGARGRVTVAGRTLFDSARGVDLPARDRGIGYVPQEREIFPSLSVMENLTVAARPGDWTVERIFELFPNLAERRGNMGNQLSGGEQQMLAIGRALMLRPRLMLLDEPSFGLAPMVVAELYGMLERVRREAAVSLLIVEQNAELALGMTDQAYILETGAIVRSGASADLRADDSIRRSYLGD